MKNNQDVLFKGLVIGSLIERNFDCAFELDYNIYFMELANTLITEFETQPCKTDFIDFIEKRLEQIYSRAKNISTSLVEQAQERAKKNAKGDEI